MAVPSRIARAARHVAGTLALVLATSSAAAAQGTVPRGSTWELRTPTGALVATGAQRKQLKDAQLTAAQLAWVPRERVALTGTFAWARSRDLVSAGSPRLDVLTADLGAELRSAEWLRNGALSLSAFAGVGAGTRSYNYRHSDRSTTTHLAGYGSVGGELRMGRVGLRIEARDYATRSNLLANGERSELRSDVVLMAGLRLNQRRAAQN